MIRDEDLRKATDYSRGQKDAANTWGRSFCVKDSRRYDPPDQPVDRFECRNSGKTAEE